ncbi:FAD-binding oxidoreductase [Martelella mediterranea]|uniref:FAD-binding oxidoreductase n=1 Tax=Martelella mediterranea TaxID=293089 RepID=UPI001E4D8C55|nr:FAD-binding oxidoreductase [Martelella mediterranea]MCD1634201.1 FAD-binding oxidoreductase [Martelella mediterranea]
MNRFHVVDDFQSWGRVVKAQHRVAVPHWRDELQGLVATAVGKDQPLLAAGLRRSYGDSVLNPAGAVIRMDQVSRMISLDRENRLLRAEAGASFDMLIPLLLENQLFLPVTPGTRFVTLGGAVANDVHGKNHHRNGSIGDWVRKLGLLRSDGREIILGPDDQSGLFRATIGGLGLTGLITWVELEVVPASNGYIDAETIAFGNLDEFFELSSRSDETHEYTVSWIDCMAGGLSTGRGLFVRGNHAKNGAARPRAGNTRFSMPVELPTMCMNRYSISTFNKLYYWKGRLSRKNATVSLYPFFYPLDSIGHWNRMYGRGGMFQYQSVVPPENQRDATREMLNAIERGGQGSFLAVLKTFGHRKAPGMISFPKPGTTLALDFPNHGPSTLALLDRLDDIVQEAGGRLYPAKDGRMSARMFQSGFENWQAFSNHVDPGFSSLFWQRVSYVGD